MDENKRVNKLHEMLEQLTVRVDNMELQQEDWEYLHLFIKTFGLLLEDREAIFKILDIVQKSHRRMCDIVGTGQDEHVATALKMLVDGEECEQS
jgi:hypothetical protein